MDNPAVEADERLCNVRQDADYLGDIYRAASFHLMLPQGLLSPGHYQNPVVLGRATVDDGNDVGNVGEILEQQLTFRAWGLGDQFRDSLAISRFRGVDSAEPATADQLAEYPLLLELQLHSRPPSSPWCAA